jgi:hypothetical protein
MLQYVIPALTRNLVDFHEILNQVQDDVTKIPRK